VQVLPSGMQHVPIWLLQAMPGPPGTQQRSPAVQLLPSGMHIGVVDVEVVLVEVLVVLLVVVVVVCAWQVPLEQFKLQHWLFLVQCLPLRLQPGEGRQQPHRCRLSPARPRRGLRPST
jgi:hypothetical protein